MNSLLGDSVASPAVWAITIVITVGVLLVDLLVIARRPHEPTMAEVSRHLAFFVGLAVVFGVALLIFAQPHELSPNPGAEFFAGWLTEYSLSIDNLFIFIIIMNSFAVPRKYQQTALMIGIVLALIMRAIFIVIGAAAINEYSWVFYIFGLFLVYTAVGSPRRAARTRTSTRRTSLVKFAESHLPATKEWNGTKLFSHRERQAPHHADVPGGADARHHRPAVRARLDPGDLRAHARPLPRLHRQHLRADGPAPALLPDRRPAAAPDLPVVRPRVPARPSSASS